VDYIPIDTATTQPQGGFFLFPEGFYLLQIKNAVETKPEGNGEHTRRVFESVIHRGPNNTLEMAGKTFYDRIRQTDERGAGNIMQLFEACFGSLQAVRELGAQHQNRLPPSTLHGRCYIVQVTKSGTFNNVMQRLPFTEEAWAASVQSAAPAAAAVPGILAATAVAPAAPQQQFVPPAAPQQFAPQQAPPQMSVPAMAPAMAPPPMMAPPAAAPVMAPPAAAPAMMAPPSVPPMPGGMPTTPTPPPPPGLPSVG